MTPIQFLKNNLKTAMEVVSKRGQDVLRQQGHNASGQLIQSFETRIKDVADGICSGELWVAEHGIYQDKGVKANRIKYNPFWLLPWAKIVKPGLSDKERKSFVFAVWMKHKKEGMHTRNSRSFSQTGKRTGWIDEMDKQSEKDVETILRIEEFFSMLVEEFVADAQNLAA